MPRACGTLGGISLPLYQSRPPPLHDEALWRSEEEEQTPHAPVIP